MDEALIIFLTEYGMFAVFVAILLEYACFPVSSEIILPISGMIGAKIHSPLILLILISVIAGLIGSSFCYIVGRCFKELFEKILNKFPKMARSFEKTCNWQRRHSKFSVMIARVIPICRTYISFVSGIVKQNYLSFLSCSSVGILVWNAMLLSVGYLLGESSQGIIPLIEKFLLFIAFVFLSVFIVKKLRDNFKDKKI